MLNLVIKSTKNTLILHLFHIRNCLTLEICRQKLNKKLSNFAKYYYKSTNTKIVFSPFKVGDLFSGKESMPKYLKCFVVYVFTCPDCKDSYIGERTLHLTMRIREDLENDTESHNFKHLSTNETEKKCVILKVLRP